MTAGHEHHQAGAPSSKDPASGADGMTPPALPAHLERGLRGVISAILVFEAIAILLGLTVIANGGRSAPLWQILAICALALAHLLTIGLVKRRFVFPLIFGLQALLVACWVIDGAIGIMGIVFTAVWVVVVVMRREFRRRVAAGTISSQ